MEDHKKGREDLKKFMDGDTRFLSLDAQIEMMWYAKNGFSKMGDVNPHTEYDRLVKIRENRMKLDKVTNVENAVPLLSDLEFDEDCRIDTAKRMDRVEKQLHVKFHPDYRLVAASFGQFSYRKEHCFFFASELCEWATRYCRQHHPYFPKDGYVFDSMEDYGVVMGAVYMQKSDGSIFEYIKCDGKITYKKTSMDLLYHFQCREGMRNEL